MLGGVLAQKVASTENAGRGCYKRSSSNSNTKELFLRKMLGGAGIEKARLTQYVRRGWREKAEFTENGIHGWSRKRFFNSIS